jgi:hypothetical protein
MIAFKDRMKLLLMRAGIRITMLVFALFAIYIILLIIEKLQ